MFSCRYISSAYMVGSTLLYLCLSLAILAQTISFPLVSGGSSSKRFVATLGQVSAPAETIHSLPATQPRFPLLSLLALQPKPQQGIQIPDEPLPDFAWIADAPSDGVLSEPKPSTTFAKLAIGELPLKFDVGLFRFSAAVGTPKHAAEPLGRLEQPLRGIASLDDMAVVVALSEKIASIR